MQVQLFKKVGTYTDKKDGKEKPFTNFYVKCGDVLVPIEVCYFPNPKCEDRDPQYNGRKQVLSAFAATLPDKHDGGNRAQPMDNPRLAPPDNTDISPVDDEDVPF